MLELLESHPERQDDGEAEAIPLPETLDTQIVVLAGMLSGGMRPLVLDAAQVRSVEPRAVPLLAALLRVKQQAGLPARIQNASPQVRAQLASLDASFFRRCEEPVDAFLTCPDRDLTGYLPSER